MTVKLDTRNIRRGLQMQHPKPANLAQIEGGNVRSMYRYRAEDENSSGHALCCVHNCQKQRWTQCLHHEPVKQKDFNRVNAGAQSDTLCLK